MGFRKTVRDYFRNNSSEAKSVEDLRYMQLMRIALRRISAFPEKELGNPHLEPNFFRKHVFLFMNFLLIVLESINLRRKYAVKDFLYNADIFLNFMLGCASLTRHILFCVPYYKENIAEFITKIHLHHTEDDSDYARMIKRTFNNICHNYTVFWIGISLYLGMVCFHGTTLLDNIRAGMLSSNPPENVTFLTSVNYYTPFDYETDRRGYVVVACLNVYISYLVMGTVIPNTLMTCSMVLHTIGNLKILTHHIEKFPLPGAGETNDQEYGYAWYTEDEMEMVMKKLREHIERHRYLMKFLDKTAALYSVIIFLYYVISQIILCVILLLMSIELKQFLRYSFLGIYLILEMMQWSIIFEYLCDTGKKLSAAIYNLPWQLMDNRGRKVVFIFLINSQRSLRIKALNMIDCGVNTMASIIKTTLSYFLLLKTFA